MVRESLENENKSRSAKSWRKKNEKKKYVILKVPKKWIVNHEMVIFLLIPFLKLSLYNKVHL